jgi:hypothetical protein
VQSDKDYQDFPVNKSPIILGDVPFHHQYMTGHHHSQTADEPDAVTQPTGLQTSLDRILRIFGCGDA